MLQWLRSRIGFYQQRYLERLLKENRSLKKQWLELNHGQPIRLSPEQKKQLAEKRKEIDPNWLKAIDAVDIEDD